MSHPSLGEYQLWCSTRIRALSSRHASPSRSPLRAARLADRPAHLPDARRLLDGVQVHRRRRGHCHGDRSVLDPHRLPAADDHLQVGKGGAVHARSQRLVTAVDTAVHLDRGCAERAASARCADLSRYRGRVLRSFPELPADGSAIDCAERPRGIAPACRAGALRPTLAQTEHAAGRSRRRGGGNSHDRRCRDGVPQLWRQRLSRHSVRNGADQRGRGEPGLGRER